MGLIHKRNTHTHTHTKLNAYNVVRKLNNELLKIYLDGYEEFSDGFDKFSKSKS